MPAPGTDITIASANWFNQLLTRTSPEWVQKLSVNSNLLLKRVGIFSNFADGLVFANPYEGLDLSILVAPYTYDSGVTGTITTALNSKTVAGAGLAGLNAGDIINVGNAVGTGPEFLVIDNPATPSVTDYPIYAVAAADWSQMVIDSSQAARTLIHIRELNVMYDYEHFFNPIIFAISTAPQALIIQADINGTGLAPAGHSVSFHTDTISANFTGDTCWFDVHAEFEIME